MPPIFVFGSNLAGRHGKGAALAAKESHGAKYGVGVGRTGNAYAIPTKDQNLKTLPIAEIAKHVKDFLAYAKSNPELSFQLTPVGTGLAGYKHQDIAPLFRGVESLRNVATPNEWVKILGATEMPTTPPRPLGTKKSGPTLANFVENPRLSVKKGEMHVSLRGGKSMPLAEAMGLVDQVIARAQAAGKQSEVARLQQAKQKLEGLTKVQDMLKQLPPTEGVMASPAQAAALQREKKVYEVNPNAPSGHFVKRSSADYQAEATPADARAARMAAYLASQEAAPTRIPAEIRTALREKFGKRLVTGSQIRESGAVTSAGVKPPSEKERIALNRAQYLEDVGGSGYSGGVPSRIENIGSPTVSDILRRGRRLIDTLGKMPTKKAASTFKALKVEMDQAVKDEAVSREVADSALNRIVEGIMTSGYGDALLSRISGGKSIRPEGIKTKRPMSAEAIAIEDKRRQTEMERPSSRGGRSVRLDQEEYPKRTSALEILSSLLGQLSQQPR